MERHERTAWGFLLSLLVIGVLVASLLLPWWTYTFSTGVRTTPGGPQPEEDTRIERERLAAYPFRAEGHSNNTTAEATQENLGRLGWLVAGSIVAMGLVALLEVPVPFYFSTRWPTLVLVTLALLMTAASLVYAWFAVPDLLAAAGVDRAYTAKPLANGYVQTWIDWGWAAGLVALLLYPGVFAFKYQAGATDPTVIESYRKPLPP